MISECQQCHELRLDCKCKGFQLDVSDLICPKINEFIIKIEGYETSNPRITGNVISIDVTPINDITNSKFQKQQ